MVAFDGHRWVGARDERARLFGIHAQLVRLAEPGRFSTINFEVGENTIWMEIPIPHFRINAAQPFRRSRVVEVADLDPAFRWNADLRRLVHFRDRVPAAQDVYLVPDSQAEAEGHV